jgi:hypothetical protein
MDPNLVQAIQWDCSQTLIRFYWCLDEKRYDELAGLFTAHGVWVRRKQELVGPAAILAAMTEREGWRTAHVVSNVSVHVVDEQNAETSQYVTLYRHEGTPGEKGPAPLSAPRAILHHRDKMVRVAGEWKFARKTSRPVMSRRGESGGDAH